VHHRPPPDIGPLLDLRPDRAPEVCPRCGTERAPQALACPACGALVHSQRLRELADRAEAATNAGDRAAARQLWLEALDLIPPGSEQHRVVGARVAALGEALGSAAASSTTTTTNRRPRSWWKQGLGLAITLGLLLIGKLKFLLLGLTKLSTFASMFGFIAVYWSLFGWPLAVGLVASIYVHEMGHVSMLRRLGIRAGAPLFIPGVGAFVMLKERVTDPISDARIGLAGPVWGLGAAVATLAVYYATGAPIWRAISELTAFINLFNLIPIWQLDGSRGFHALTRQERWIVVAAVVLTILLTGQRMLWIIAAVAVFRAVRSTPGPGHLPTLATFVGLIASLAWLARTVR
jgi:Zn-dependent protease